jgi:RNA polymerase sigma factor (sigma-70 family)
MAGGGVGVNGRKAELWREYRLSPTPAAAWALVVVYRPWVRKLARVLLERGTLAGDVDDWAHEGLLGVFASIPRFEPLGGTTFTAFARRRVLGAMLDAARRAAFVPRSARLRGSAVRLFSLDRKRAGGFDVAGGIDDTAAVDRRDLVAAVLERGDVDADERELIRLRFVEGLGNEEIGRRLGVVGTRISQRLGAVFRRCAANWRRCA